MRERTAMNRRKKYDTKTIDHILCIFDFAIYSSA